MSSGSRVSSQISNTFSDQFWTICMYFGKSATNFDIATAESCPAGRRTAEPPKLPALFPKCMHCRLNWPEKGVVLTSGTLSTGTVSSAQHRRCTYATQIISRSPGSATSPADTRDSQATDDMGGVESNQSLTCSEHRPAVQTSSATYRRLSSRGRAGAVEGRYRRPLAAAAAAAAVAGAGLGRIWIRYVTGKRSLRLVLSSLLSPSCTRHGRSRVSARGGGGGGGPRTPGEITLRSLTR